MRPEMSMEKLDVKQIKLVPALFGEVDLIKVIQMLPGVQATSEGSSGFSVRGGSPAQNLILFDDAVIYNASHLMGFFSTFNNDAVEGLTLYKGDIPAAYGGRLSSLLEVRGKPGANDFAMDAGVGLIASRLALQGPLLSDRATFLIAGRRTYADLFLPLATDQSLHNVSLHFYDLNVKVQGRIDHKNFLSFTGYYGRDKYGGIEMGLDFGNMAGTLRWKHLFSENMYLQTEWLGSSYDYLMFADTPSLVAEWKAGIYSMGGRADMVYLSGNDSFRFGWATDYKWFRPGNAHATITGTEYLINIARKQAWENAVYFSGQHTLFERLTLKYGLRATRFDNIGPTTEYRVDGNYALADSMLIPSGKFYNHYWGLEPRIGATCVVSDAVSVKASYARTMQFMHLLSTSTSGSPLEIWVPSNHTIKPETAHQLATGVFANLWDNRFEVSLEAYYKTLRHVLDFKDHPQVMMNSIVETEVREGSGTNYGLEFMLRKNTGNPTGWISYTYSRAFRNVPGINGGKDYSAPFDRPNTINIIASYTLGKRLTLSANWVYSTGQPVTFPEARYLFGKDYVPVYTARNTYRFPDYHRMDVSLDVQLGKLTPHKKWRHALNISVYNLYGRKNPWTINFKTDPADNSQYAQMTYLFGVVPSVTYTLSFNKK
ncbi:MAG: TonB-dependent receptor plug domain-containing protein [Prevotellaceae bacterium]|nr:TonB-dependent receptor plug domain-containing protein [Prevotellaceae bacterium]